jgi:hypothetical protein
VVVSRARDLRLRAMPGISRCILAERIAPTLPYLLEQPSPGRRHPVKPTSRRSRARDQREA